MSNETVVREAFQKQALLLRSEFEHIEEIRTTTKPFYDQFNKRAEIHFTTPYGVCRVWWEAGCWVVTAPDGKFVYAMPKMLRKTLQDMTERLKEEAIMEVMQYQIERLRSEYGDLEEFVSWARPLYDYDLERAELRFDTPVGICRVWWEGVRWVIKIPGGGVKYASPGSLRENLSLVRKYLRQGIT
jgi:hypothetical protein